MEKGFLFAMAVAIVLSGTSAAFLIFCGVSDHRRDCPREEVRVPLRIAAAFLVFGAALASTASAFLYVQGNAHTGDIHAWMGALSMVMMAQVVIIIIGSFALLSSRNEVHPVRIVVFAMAVAVLPWLLIIEGWLISSALFMADVMAIMSYLFAVFVRRVRERRKKKEG